MIDLNDIILLISKTTPLKVITLGMVLIVLDCLSGTITAIILGEWESSKMRKGFLGKLQWIISFLMGVVFSYTLNTNIVLYFFVSGAVITEFGSILENMRKCGINLKEVTTNENN